MSHQCGVSSLGVRYVSPGVMLPFRAILCISQDAIKHCQQAAPTSARFITHFQGVNSQKKHCHLKYFSVEAYMKALT